MLASVLQLVRREGIYAQLRGAHLILCGHSLGATYAESIFVLLQQPAGVWSAAQSRPWFSSEAITFDSPGQPSSFRIQHALLLPCMGVTTLNAAPNIVNTLHAPCADRLFSCSPGSNVSLTRTLTLLRDLSMKVITSLGLSNLRSHALLEIRQHLMDGSILEEQPRNWPTYTNQALQLLSHVGAACSTWLRTAPPTIEPLVMRADPVPELGPPPEAAAAMAIPGPDAEELRRDPVDPAAPPPGPPLSDLPVAFGQMEICTPYRIPNLAAWTRFTSMLRGTDRVLLLMGLSAQGKTSILKVLLGLPFHDRRLRITGGVNSTRQPIVALLGGSIDAQGVRRNVFVADLPGSGAHKLAVGADRDQFMLTNDFWSINAQLRDYVPCVMFVQQDPAGNAAIDYYRDIQSAGYSIVRVFNYGTDTEEEKRERRANFEASFPGGAHTLQCKVLSSHHQNDADRLRLRHDVAELIHFKEQLLRNAVIADGLRLAVAQAAAQQHFPRNWGVEKKDIGVAAAAAVAVWLPGMIWWGSWAGTVLVTTSFGVIASGPLAVAGAVTGATYVGRRMLFQPHKRQV
jgi:hypothetical protein